MTAKEYQCGSTRDGVRVITGSARGHKLQMVPGDSTRPITDRAKEALFSILSDWIVEHASSTFSAVPALSESRRSAGAARSPSLWIAIAAPSHHSGQSAPHQVARPGARRARRQLRLFGRYQGEPFDLIYIAPPQYQDLWRKVLNWSTQAGLLAPFATVIVQIHPREDAPVELNFWKNTTGDYGSVLLIFFAASTGSGCRGRR